MTHCSSAIPARGTALAVLGLALFLTGCNHTEPFTNEPGSDVPFDPGPPARLTLNPANDANGTWLADGSGILYSAQQLDRADADVCLAELPPTGGSQRLLICDIPGDTNSTDAAQTPAAAADGRLGAPQRGQPNARGNQPDASDARRRSFLGCLEAPNGSQPSLDPRGRVGAGLRRISPVAHG